MNIVLWIVQILLALAFVLAGATKALQPMETLAGRMPWVDDYSTRTVRLIGVLEILGGLGLVLPWALNIATVLTPLAAVGLAIIMVLAAVHHGHRGEMAQVGFNVLLLVLALFVAWGRFTAS